MKKLLMFLMVIVSGTLLGCGATAKEIRAKSFGEKTDVFHEVKGGGAPPQGFADLVIQASVKTHNGC